MMGRIRPYKFQRAFRSISVVMILVLCATQLYSRLPFIQAQDSMKLDSLSYIISPVSVYAPVFQRPFAVSVIDPLAIQQLAEPTMEPLLNSTAGLWMQTGTLNTNRISIRGVGYREPFATTGIKVYLDEIPLTNGVGEASIEDIHPWILSGIEVWRGPSSALWGSGLGGMIHLRTSMPVEDQWISSIQAGSFDRWRLDQHLSFRSGASDQWGTTLQYQYVHDAGYRDNNAYRKHSFTWMQHWKQDAWTIKTLLHRIDLRAFIPSSITLEDFRNRPTIAAPTWAAVNGHEAYTKWISGVHIMYMPASGWIYRGSVFGTFFDSDEVRPFNVLKEDNTSAGMRHRVSAPVGRLGHITVGMEYYKDWYDFSTFETLDGGQAGVLLSNQQERRNYIHGFLQSEWNLGEKWIMLGGMGTAQSTLKGAIGKSDLPVSIYPTAGISYRLQNQLAISASISRGYSSLSLEDILNSDGTIDPAIIPESGWSKEMSLKGGDGIISFFQLTAYDMRVANTIITRRIRDDVFEKINGGSTKHRGIELEYKWRPANSKLAGSGAVSVNNYVFDRFNDGGIERSGNRLPGTSAFRTFHRMEWWPWRNLSLLLDHHWVSKVYLNDANSVSDRGYNLFNAGIRYTLTMSETWEGVIAGHLHNVTDTEYSPMYQVNAPGTSPRYFYPGKPRAVYLNLSLKHVL